MKPKTCQLHGWDDEKLYYWTEQGEICVLDIPELIDQLEEICGGYVERMPKKRDRHD